MATTTSTNRNELGLIKTDSLGRVYVDKAHREALLDSFETSALSGPKFATLHGVKYQTFATWMQKRKRERGQYPVATGSESTQKLIDSLVELELPPSAAEAESKFSGEGLFVEHASGVTMTIADERQAVLAAVLLNQLSPSSPC